MLECSTAVCSKLHTLLIADLAGMRSPRRSAASVQHHRSLLEDENVGISVFPRLRGGYTTAADTRAADFGGASAIRATPMTASTADPTRNPTRWPAISRPSIDIATGSTYAGIRHALPVVVLLAIIGGVAVHAGFSSTSRTGKAVVMLALVAAAMSAFPVMRPWGYFNEIVGSKNAYLYFSDEGVDLGQRGNELEQYRDFLLELEPCAMRYEMYDK